MSKKLLFISHVSSLGGGAERSLIEIISGCVSRGYDCTLLTQSSGNLQEEALRVGSRVDTLPFGWSAYTRHSTESPEDITSRSILESFRYVERNKPDLIITNTILVPWFAYTARVLNIPSIIMIRELFDDKNSIELFPSADRYLALIKQSVDFIFFNSKYTKSTYEDLLDGIGNDILYPSISEETKKKLLHISPAVFTRQRLSMLHIGTIVPHKNQLLAVKSVKELRAIGIDVSLTMIGLVTDDSYFARINDYITENNLSSSINIKPYTNDISNEIKQHNIILMMSENEAFGRVTLEGQLGGRLVIGLSAGGTTEIIKHKETGLLLEHNSPEELVEAIKWINYHNDYASKIATKGQAWANNFSSINSTMEGFFDYLSTESSHDESRVLGYDPIYALTAKIEQLQSRIDSLNGQNIEIHRYYDTLPLIITARKKLIDKTKRIYRKVYRED